MAIRVEQKFRMNGISWQSGHVYTFRYNAWQHDPHPTIVLMGRYTGLHPNTGHQWRLIQGINLSYVPRSHRRLFAIQWIQEYERTGGDTRFTWQIVKRRFPFLQYAVRRYLFKPAYYIQKPIEIQFEDLEDAIIDTWAKDFSKKIRIDLMKKYHAVRSNVKKHNVNPFGRFLNKVFKG